MAALAGVVVALAGAPTAAAYPGCYYSYRGCYLVPGWYDGYYWGGGPWYGWGGGYGPVAPNIGCIVPYETGMCGPNPLDP